MNKERKAQVVEELATQIRASGALFAVDYRGISVPQAAELRRRLTEAGARFRVVKNTLSERAAEEAGAESLKELLEGPTAFTFVNPDGGDVALAAKALAQFRREHHVLDFKGGLMEGEPLSADQIQEIARLPARDVLHGQLVGVLASPLTGLARGLNGLVSGLAVALGQIAEQGLLGGPGPAAAEEPAAQEPAAEAETASEQAAEAPATGDAAFEDDQTTDAPAEGATTDSEEA